MKRLLIAVAMTCLSGDANAQRQVELSFPVTEESIVLPIAGHRSSAPTNAQAQLQATATLASARLYLHFDVEVPLQLGALSLLDLRIDIYNMYIDGSPTLTAATISSDYDISRMLGEHMPYILHYLPVQSPSPSRFVLDANALTRDPMDPRRIRANMILFVEQPTSPDAIDGVVLSMRDFSNAEPERSRFAPWLVASYDLDAPVGRETSSSWGLVKSLYQTTNR